MKLKSIRFVFLLLLISSLAFVMSGCGSSGSGTAPEPTAPTDDDDSGDTGGDTDTPATPSILSLSLSQTTVKSDNTNSASVIATVLDESRAVIEGVAVEFSTDAGQLSRSSAVTDANGQAQTEFSSGTDNPKNQTATISAEVEGLDTAIIPIQIIGSKLTISTNNPTITDDGSVGEHYRFVNGFEVI